MEEQLGFSPELTVLKASSQRLSVLLYQHTGKLLATKEKIGNATDVSGQLDEFFNLARSSKAELVLTPEYCCPINRLQCVLDASANWPGKKRLWVIGGESITLEDLNSLRDKYENGNVKVCFDDSVLDGTKNFLCPLFYIFREGQHLHVVIQFKVSHCGVWSDAKIESENIILGEKIYVFGRKDGVRLFSLICADAMIFSTIKTQDWMEWRDAPYLILNPQLNPEPKHPLFIDFRKIVMNVEHKEIITLNWNANSKGHHGDLMSFGHSRSGLVISSKEIELKETKTMIENHKKGLSYFKFDAPDRHAFFCNSLVDAFLLNIHAVVIRDVTRPQARKDAPVVEGCYLFSDEFKLLPKEDVVTTAFMQFLQNNKCVNHFLNNPAACILEKERLVTLSAGEILKGDSEWYKVPNLFSIRLEESYEINNRITLFEDRDRYSKWQRKRFLRAVKKLDGILKDERYLPKSMEALKDKKLYVGYSRQAIDSNYKFNIVDEQGMEVVGTICYLDDGDPGDVQRAFDILQRIVGKGGERGRVVVFYDNDGIIDSKCDPDYGKFTNGNDHTGGIITK